jgi:hypothetical protein
MSEDTRSKGDEEKKRNAPPHRLFYLLPSIPEIPAGKADEEHDLEDGRAPSHWTQHRHHHECPNPLKSVPLNNSTTLFNGSCLALLVYSIAHFGGSLYYNININLSSRGLE